MLAYRNSADSINKNLEIAESIVLECLNDFTNAVCSIYSTKYLHYHTEDDLQWLLLILYQRGFPGMLGSINCMHWVWKNCMVSLAGQYKGKESKPTMVLEAIVDRNLWLLSNNLGIQTLNKNNTFANHRKGKGRMYKERLEWCRQGGISLIHHFNFGTRMPCLKSWNFAPFYAT